MRSYSQLAQDLRVLEFYKLKTNGFFVDIGAADGIELSNTYLLESRANWKGICVEPNPNNYNKLIVNRPTAICCDKAIYNETGLTLDFDIAHDGPLLSGISSDIGSKWKSTVDNNKTTIKVQTLLLTELLDQNNAPNFIHYLSLDTEGSEYEILKNFRFDKYIFGLIDVEHNYEEPRRSQIREILLANGYIYMGENKWDDSYKHNSV
jgi:FkbM family methyltransferase